ncbi:MAG: putative hydrolase of the superfamily [Chloroflexota bacterium]|jgi:putative hydrolase of the HAD superfamily|nr:putative hydrolase of the superfamily [Chloroflexota bacterium]
MIDEIRAVFFDVGGTLAYPHPSFHGLMAEVCQAHGLMVTPEDAAHAEVGVWEKIARREDAGRGYSASFERSREFWLWVYRTFLEDLGFPEAAQSPLPERLWQTFTRLESYRLFEDSLPTLQAVSGRGLILGVISNWEEWLERLIAGLGIAEFFDVVVISGVHGIEKPDPAIFQLALEKAGVRPEEAIHIGDSPRDDVEGALAVGMRAVLLDRKQAGLMPTWGQKNAMGAATTVRSLLELPALLGIEAR